MAGGGGCLPPHPGTRSHLFLQDPIVEVADEDAEEAERQPQPVGHQGVASGHETPRRPHWRPAHSLQRQRRRQLQPDIADRRQGPHRSCMRPPLSRAPQPPPQLPAQGCRGGNASEPRNRFQGKEKHPGILVSSLRPAGGSCPEVNVLPSRLFQSGNSEDNYNPELRGTTYKLCGRGVMM